MAERQDTPDQTYLCCYCDNSLPVTRARVHCLLCYQYDLCADCHVTGVVTEPHKPDHPYNVWRHDRVVKTVRKGIGERLNGEAGGEIPKISTAESEPATLKGDKDDGPHLNDGDNRRKPSADGLSPPEDLLVYPSVDKQGSNLHGDARGDSKESRNTPVAARAGTPAESTVSTASVSASSKISLAIYDSTLSGETRAALKPFQTTAQKAFEDATRDGAGTSATPLTNEEMAISDRTVAEKITVTVINTPSALAPADYWDQLITPSKELSPTFLRLLEAVFTYLDSTVTPLNTGYIEPMKFCALTRAMRKPPEGFTFSHLTPDTKASAKQFQQLDAYLLTLYNVVGVDYRLSTRAFPPHPIPPIRPVNGRIRKRDLFVAALTQPQSPVPVPNGMPLLTPLGFQQFFLLNALSDPSDTFEDLTSLLRTLPLIDPSTNAPFPPLPRSALPPYPDPELKARQASVQAAALAQESETTLETNARANKTVSEAYRNINGTYKNYTDLRQKRMQEVQLAEVKRLQEVAAREARMEANRGRVRAEIRGQLNGSELIGDGRYEYRYGYSYGGQRPEWDRSNLI